MEITGLQIRAARVLLGWKATELADAAGVHVATVQRFETGATVIPAVRYAIVQAMQDEGVEFPQHGVIAAPRAAK